MIRLRAVPVLILSLLVSDALFSQQERNKEEKPVAQTTIRAVSEVVVLDLVVRDKDGRPVRNLRRDELEVYEDGVKQDLTSFRFVGEAGTESDLPTAAGQEKAEEVGPKKKLEFDPFRNVNLVALVFERLPDTARHTARQAALHFLETGMPKNTLVAVFAVDNRLWLLQQFTNDREPLKEAILRATSGAYGEFDSQSMATIEGQVRDSARQLGDPTAQGVEGGPGITPSVAEIQAGALEEVTMNVLRHADRIMRYQRGHASLSALLALVHEQGRLAGRKTLVLFSAGIEVPPDLVSRFQMLKSEANRSNVSIYTVDARGLTSEELMGSAKYLFNQAVEASRRQQETGLGRMVTREETMIAEWAETSMRMNKQGTLDDLARSTGGFLVANTNDPRSSIERLSEDIRTYYEAAYTPTNLTYDGKFRAIIVKVLRPNVRVQSRAGYFAVPPSDESPILPYEIPLLVALNSESLPEQFEHHTRILRFDGNQQGVQHVFVLEVPLATFTFTENRENRTYDTRFSVMVLLKDEQRRIIRKFTQDYPLQGPWEKVDLVKDGNVIFMREFELPPGRYTAETAVVDHLSQRMSARRTSLVVYDRSSQLHMSSLSVIRRVDPLREDDPGEGPLEYEKGRIIPDLEGAILQEREKEVALYCIIYPEGGSAEHPQLTLEILRDGQVVGRGTRELPQADAQGRIKFLGTIPVNDFGPGRYEVRMWVQQAKATIKEHAFFSIARLNL